MITMAIKIQVLSYNGEEATGERGDEVFACPGTHDGVVSPADCRAVVGCHHQAHLYKLGGVAR